MARGQLSVRRESSTEVVWNSRSRAAAGSLFDRLIIDDEDIDFPSYGGDRIDGIVRSIKRNLDRVLNMHAGGAAANPELGITDMNHSTVNALDVSDHIVSSIRNCILASEPRITEVKVNCVNDPDAPLTLQFAIVCMVKVSSVAEQIQIDLAMKDGHFHQLDR